MAGPPVRSLAPTEPQHWLCGRWMAVELNNALIGALLGSSAARALDNPQPSHEDTAHVRNEAEPVLLLRPGLPEAVQLLDRIAEVEARL